MRAVAVQLMEVVYGVKDNDWLVKLLRGMIFGPAGGDKQKKVCSQNKHEKGGGKHVQASRKKGQVKQKNGLPQVAQSSMSRKTYSQAVAMRNMRLSRRKMEACHTCRQKVYDRLAGNLVMS